MLHVHTSQHINHTVLRQNFATGQLGQIGPHRALSAPGGPGAPGGPIAMGAQASGVFFRTQKSHFGFENCIKHHRAPKPVARGCVKVFWFLGLQACPRRVFVFKFWVFGPAGMRPLGPGPWAFWQICPVAKFCPSTVLSHNWGPVGPLGAHLAPDRLHMGPFGVELSSNRLRIGPLGSFWARGQARGCHLRS